jgi:predicted lipase
MTLVGFTAVEEIMWKLEPQVKDVLFFQRYEVILMSRHSTDHIDIWDAFARGVCMHLYFHVPFEVPSEDIMLEGVCLSEDELDYVRMTCCEYLR